MINKIINFIKGLFSEDNVKKNRSRIEKLETVLEPIITKEESVVEEEQVEKVIKKPRKQATKKTTAKKKKED